MTHSTGEVARVALVTQGFDTGGGVPATTRWLRDGLRECGYTVEVLDLANSSGDANSRRLLAPRSWFRSSLAVHSAGDGTSKWGANLVEIEAMRYRPRRELDRVLNTFDIVQVVSGTPALARVTRRVDRPVMLLAATMVRWERQSAHADAGLNGKSIWRRLMTSLHARAELPALWEADFVFTINDSAARHIAKLGQSAVAMAPPGVDVDVYTPHPAGWQRNGVLLSVCRLADVRKGLDRLVLAYVELLRIRPKAPDLILAGRGEPDPRVLALIADHELEHRIHVRSDVSFEDLPGLMQSASVFLQSSHEEGLGISVVEAMASGVPTVATETHGSRETIEDGVTGHVVPQLTDDQIVTDFARLIGSLLDGSGAEMGESARHRAVSLFSKADTLARITDRYSAALATDSSRGTEMKAAK